MDRIFATIQNLKHLAMLQVLFYGCLRATELCNLNDEDVDLQALMLRINNGKGGKDGIVYIADECAHVLKDYLAVRPPLILERNQLYSKRTMGNDGGALIYTICLPGIRIELELISMVDCTSFPGIFQRL